jgi:hypothetical protein
LAHPNLAEIAAICALEGGFAIVAVVDEKLEAERFTGAPLRPDGVAVTDARSGAATLRAAIAKFGAERVLAPALPDVRPNDSRGTA